MNWTFHQANVCDNNEINTNICSTLSVHANVTNQKYSKHYAENQAV